MAPVTAGSPASNPALVRWRGEADPRLRTAFRHLVAAAFLAVGVLTVLGVVLFGYATLAAGATGTFLALVVVLLVGGPFSLLSLAAIRREVAFSELLPYDLDLTPRYVLLAVPVAVVAVVAALRFPPVGFALLLGAPLVWATIAARDSAGTLDVEAGTLTVDDGTAGAPRGPRDVRALRSHSARRVGGYRLLRLRYAGPATLSRPSFLVVPESDYARVDAALSAVETRDYGVDTNETPLAATAVLAGLGALFVAVGVGLAVSTGGWATGALGPAAMLASFGLLFVGLAWLA